MNIVMFYHSLISDWNHGNAHFLRGIAAELIDRGHKLTIYEPAAGWSLQNLIRHHGSDPVRDFHLRFPTLDSILYEPETLDIDAALADADLVIVHEWNDRELVSRIGRYRSRRSSCRLLFHDTHHRCVSDPQTMAQYDLTHYDGVLAFGKVVEETYLRNHWAARAWTWHEAADTRIFRPIAGLTRDIDLVWIGNWGDDERAEELHEFLIEPVRRLSLKACIWGVSYPAPVLDLMAKHNISYHGWLPNYLAPRAFARAKLTVHIPRRPYVNTLKGIPTIRPFEALACGTPLICSPWSDCENLFTAGNDYLIAQDGREMISCIKNVLGDPALSRSLSEHGLYTILTRHTCAHRVEQLLDITRSLGLNVEPACAVGSAALSPTESSLRI